MPKKAAGGLDAQGQRIQGVAAPTTATDAANKSYVDSLAALSAWPFLDASAGGSNQVIQTLAAGNFTTLTLAKNTDSHDAFNNSTYIYTIPQTGVYQMVGKYRVVDSAGIFSHGIGVGKLNGDGPDFLWKDTENARNNIMNVITKFLNAGDQIRLFGFVQQNVGIIATSLVIQRIR